MSSVLSTSMDSMTDLFSSAKGITEKSLNKTKAWFNEHPQIAIAAKVATFAALSFGAIYYRQTLINFSKISIQDSAQKLVDFSKWLRDGIVSKMASTQEKIRAFIQAPVAPINESVTDPLTATIASVANSNVPTNAAPNPVKEIGELMANSLPEIVANFVSTNAELNQVKEAGELAVSSLPEKIANFVSTNAELNQVKEVGELAINSLHVRDFIGFVGTTLERVANITAEELPVNYNCL